MRRAYLAAAVALAAAAGLSGGGGAILARPLSRQEIRPPQAARIGVDLDGLGDGARARPFADVAKTLRPWTTLDGQKPAPVDERGWPTSDAESVMFDIRPVAAWLGPEQIDDPVRFQPDWSGVYPLSFQGQARVQATQDSRYRISSPRYNAATNTTTAEVTVPKGAGLLVLAFSETRRSPGSPAGSGITDLRLLRPGSSRDRRATFTPEFVRSLQPFAVLRYMDWLDTNHNPGFYGDRGHHALNWADRKLPADATQQFDGRKYGVAWEYVVALANQTGKDLWITIPVAATDDYVLQLAGMLKRDLAPNLKIYLEHSNEVWNFGFPQYIYNKLAAVDEVSRGNSPLQNDGGKDQEEWARRRHAKRLVEIGETFRKVFGESGTEGRIRPVYASWVINPDSYYANVLAWVEKTYGPPKRFFYGIAGAAYYNAAKAGPSATPALVLEAMRAASMGNRKFLSALQQIAGRYGLNHCQYEVGPDTGGGKRENVGNRILANRLPGMRDLVLEDARAWFAQGGDLYIYFSHCSAYSRYGCWGLSDDIANLQTPKWQAIYELTGRRP
jgi:hypothetical protein